MPQNAVTDADEELPPRGAQCDPTGRHFSSWAGVGRQDEDKVSTDERALKAYRGGLGCQRGKDPSSMIG